MASFNLIRLLAKPFKFPASSPSMLTAASDAAFSGPLKYATKTAAKRAANLVRATQRDQQAPVSKLTKIKSKFGLLSQAFNLQGAFAKKPSRKSSVSSVASAKPRNAMEILRTPVQTTSSLETAFKARSQQVEASFAISRNSSNASSLTISRKAAAVAQKTLVEPKGHKRESASFDSWDTSDVLFDLPLIIEEAPAATPAPGAMTLRNMARVESVLLPLPKTPFHMLNQAADSQESVSRYSSLPATPRSFGSQATSSIVPIYLGSTARNSEETLATSRLSISSEQEFRVKSAAFSLDIAPLQNIDNATASTATLVDHSAYVLPALKFDTTSLLYDVFMTSGSLKRQNTTGGRVLVEGHPYYEFF